MAKNTELDCKKIYIVRCGYATLHSVLLQYFLLAIYLLFVNFSIFHPIVWIISTIRLIFSFYTWLYMIPLICFVILNGVMLGRFHLNVHRYHPTRLARIWHTTPTKAMSLIVHICIGILTTWLYSIFLAKDYGKFYIACYEQSHCINEKHTFLMLNGIFASLYYFYNNSQPSSSHCIVFPIVQNTIYSAIRAKVYVIIFRTFRKSYWPTLCFVTGYYIASSLIRPYISFVFGYDIDSSHFSIIDLKYFLFNWMIFTHIISNMKLMSFLCAVFLTETKQFAIEPMIAVDHQCEPDVTLADALSCTTIPMIQKLAALDLCSLANHTDSTRRSQIFSLSIPGGHPYHWNLISGQCLSILDSYRDTLAKSVKKLRSTPNNNQIFPPMQTIYPTPAAELAEKIRFRQFNESIGIRNMSFNEQNDTAPPQMVSANDPCQRFNLCLAIIGDKVTRLKNGFVQTTGVHYLFGESETGHISFMLSERSELVAWTAEALSTLAAHSLNEDKYGVVQDKLGHIIKSLLTLKQALDKISAVSMLDLEAKQNCVALRNKVRRSIYKICTVFADYMPDLIADANELRIIQNYVNYKES